MFKPNLKNIHILSATESCKVENRTTLTKEFLTLSGIFSNRDFSRILSEERSSEAGMGEGSKQRPVLRVSEHIKTLRAALWLNARQRLTTVVYYIIIQVIDEHVFPEPSVLRTGAVMCTA